MMPARTEGKLPNSAQARDQTPPLSGASTARHSLTSPSIRHFRRPLLLAMLPLTLLLLHCSGGSGSTFTLSETRKELFRFDSKGGSSCSSQGLCIHIPAGSTESTTSFFGALQPQEQGTIGAVYLLETSAPLKKPIELELPVPAAQQDKALDVAYHKDGAWLSVSTRAGKNKSTRIGQTDHLSRWSLILKKDGCNPGQGTCTSQSEASQSEPPPSDAGTPDAGTPDADAGDKASTQEPGRPDGGLGDSTPSETQCPTGASLCGTRCVNTQLSQQHCGACNKVCQEKEACVAGACKATTCAAGEVTCGGSCVSLSGDTRHCGKCDNKCPKGQMCHHGACTPAPKGSCYMEYHYKSGRYETVLCDGACRNLNNDPQHCGGCYKACKAGQACCNGKCATLGTDLHCSSCNNRCLGHHTCQQGTCKRNPKMCDTPGRTACKHPFTKLDAQGNDIAAPQWRCVDLTKNVDHCGKCGNKCPKGVGCVKGVCTGDRYPMCGSLGQCDERSNCIQKEANGKFYFVCQSDGYLYCPGGPVLNNPSVDNKNCGGCGLECPKNTICGGRGWCYDNFDGFPSGGTDLMADKVCDGLAIHYSSLEARPEHCGDCYAVCEYPQICGRSDWVAKCECPSGGLLCQGKCVGPSFDRNHCGGCGKVCPKGTVCESGKCKTSSQLPFPLPNAENWLYCDGAWTLKDVDPLHCGSCGNVCPEGKFCYNAQCTST